MNTTFWNISLLVFRRKFTDVLPKHTLSTFRVVEYTKGETDRNSFLLVALSVLVRKKFTDV
jgi:hypothetical protein